MVRKWMAWINYSACIIIALFLLGAIYFFWAQQRSFSIHDETIKTLELPKSSFARSAKDYEAIGAPALSLAFSPLSVQLPDLRRYLVYYGKNGRPDAQNDKQALYFAFTGNKTPTSLFPGERLYLLYDKKITPNQYVFSPDNTPTPIWIEATPQGNQALVKVAMKTEEGKIIKEPAAYAEFTLPEKEFVRSGGATWELGKWRVDGTLLARQKARWVGLDKFLEKHGGPEYQDYVNKQRIDFGEGNEVYSVYVGAGDCLIWADGQWKSVKVGEGSLNSPLLCVKKVDERVMNLELWDVGGKGKITLNLVRSNEAWSPQSLEQQFKFVGARTRTQFVFEINHERMLLRPHDWLLFTDSGWKKLVTPKQIDDYVERKTVGPLFVFDRVEKKEDRQIIQGTFFNSARTEMAPVELGLQQSSPAPSGPGALPGNEKKQKTKESNPRSMIKSVNKPEEKPITGKPQRVEKSERAIRGEPETEN